MHEINEKFEMQKLIIQYNLDLPGLTEERKIARLIEVYGKPNLQFTLVYALRYQFRGTKSSTR